MRSSTPRGRGRRLAAAVVLAAVCVGGVACDGPGGEPQRQASSRPPGPLRQLTAEELLPTVTSALAQARTASFTVTVATTGSDPTATTGSLSLEGVLRLDRRGVDLAAAGTGDHDLDVVLLDRALYVRDAAVGEQWLALDLADRTHPLSLLGRTADPRRLLAAMGTPQATFVGEEEVGGVPTHHYTLALAPAAYVEALGLPEGFVRYLPGTIPLDLWIDGDQRPRRLHQEVQSVGAAGSAPVTTVTDATWSDFGARVRIAAPPAAETTTTWPGM